MERRDPPTAGDPTVAERLGDVSDGDPSVGGQKIKMGKQGGGLPLRMVLIEFLLDLFTNRISIHKGYF